MDDNTKTVWLVAIPLTVTLLTGVTTAYVAIKQAELAARVKAVAENVQTVERATNSMKDALVEATAKASFAEGQATEKAEQGVRETGKTNAVTKAASEKSKAERAQYERDRAQYERDRKK